MNDSDSPQIRPRSAWPGRWALAALAVTVLLVIVVRGRLLQIPLERDEGEYAYAGQLLLEGIPPYKMAYNMKLPGTYASYAAIMAVFGQSTAGIHLGFLVVILGTMALLFFIARRLFDSEHASVACVCYGLFSMSPGVLGLEGHATHLVMLAALGGVLLLLKARDSGRIWTFGWSGVLFGLSFVCKQPGVFFAMFGVVVLVRDLVPSPRAAGRGSGRGVPDNGDPPLPSPLLHKPVEEREEANLRTRSACQGLKNIVFFCAGLALPFLLTCLLMACAGTFDRFWFWTVVYAKAHGGLLTWREGLADLVDFYDKSGVMKWTWVIAMLGLLCLTFDKQRRDAKAIVSFLLLFSLIAFTASFYFSRHYFIMALPVVCLLIAVAVRRAAHAYGEGIPGGVFALACAGFIFANRALWFEQTPEAVSHSLYGGNPFPEAIVLAKYLQEHSSPNDTITIMGSEPEIFFYAHRHSATGYIYMYDLMQRHKYAKHMQEETIQQIEAAKPAFLLLVYVNTSWTFSRDSNLAIMDWLKVYWGKYYNTAGMAWILPDRTEYVWGQEAASKTFDTALRIAILQRKPGV